MKQDRATRHARQGVQAAVRTFCRIRLGAATADQARAAVDEALARIEAGPAPEAFRTAARAELVRRFEDAYPSSSDDAEDRVA